MENNQKTYSQRMDDNIKEATYYLKVAKECIEAEYGHEYAEAHPELVAAFMQTVAIKDLESSIVVTLENLNR